MKGVVEQGSVSAFVVGLVLTMLSCSALVVDGGHLVSEYIRHADLAENAARSGTQELRSLRSGDPRVDPGRAREAALDFLAAHGVDGDVVVRDNAVVVTISASIDFALLTLVGLRSTSITVVRSAEPVVA